MIVDRWWTTGLVPLAMAAAGCSDGGVLYGPPGGLAGKSLPQPTLSTGSGEPQTDGGTVADAALVDEGAGPSGDASPCAVSWSAQIFVNMTAAGRWGCTDSSCHGGQQSPKMTSDAKATYASLAAFTMRPPAKAVPFILPGSSDPSQSGLECNLSGNTCGPQMPLTQAGAQPLTKEDVAMIDAWVKCGAPNN